MWELVGWLAGGPFGYAPKGTGGSNEEGKKRRVGPQHDPKLIKFLRKKKKTRNESVRGKGGRNRQINKKCVEGNSPSMTVKKMGQKKPGRLKREKPKKKKRMKRHRDKQQAERLINREKGTKELVGCKTHVMERLWRGHPTLNDMGKKRVAVLGPNWGEGKISQCRSL